MAVGGASVYAAMIVASAIVLGAVTDRVIIPALEDGQLTTGGLVAAAAAIIGVAVVKAVGIVARRAGASLMQARLQGHHRKAVTRRYQRLPLAWHRQHTTGELLSRANSDVEAMFWMIAPFPMSVGVIVLLAISIVVLLLTDVWMGLIAAAIVPALAALNWRYNRLAVAPTTRSQQLRGQVSSVAHESFDGALTIKTLGREADETRRFTGPSAELRDALTEVGRLRALFDPTIEAVPTLAIIAVLVVGATRVEAGVVTAGDIVRVAFLLTLLAFPVRIIGYLISEFPRAVVGWDRVREVTEAEAALPAGAARGSGAGAADLDVVDLAYTYEDGEGPVLEAVTFAAAPGRTIAVVGPTGSGKSTLASLLVRLADPDAGAVRLDGLDLRDLRTGGVAREATIVFQESFLFADTVRENITLGEDFSDEEVVAAARLAQADGFIRRLAHGYETRIGERGATLSGGQRQRLALARALVRRPRLLILDDATSSVDARVEAAILQGLKDAALPSTVVVIATRPATIALADEVVFVEHGRVVSRGPHQHLLETEPRYSRLLEAYRDDERRSA